MMGIGWALIFTGFVVMILDRVTPEWKNGDWTWHTDMEAS